MSLSYGKYSYFGVSHELRKMCAFSLGEAKWPGHKAMQRTIGFKSNDCAVRMWQKLGFTINGEIADALYHRPNKLTNEYIKHREL